MKGIYTELKDKEIPYLLDFKPDFIWAGRHDEKRLKQLHDVGIKNFRSIGIFCAQGKVEKQKHRAINKRRKPIETYQGWYVGLCPTDPEIRSKRLKEIRTAFNSPYVDGVWLDSIRYPTYWETPKPKYLDTCYCKRCLSMFQKSGLSWIDYRIEQIRLFIKEVVKLRNDKILGYFAVPETDDKLEKVFVQPLKIFKNYFNYASPMIYPQMIHRDFIWAQQTVEKFHDVFTKDRVIPIIQLVKMPDDSVDTFTIEATKILLNTISNLGSVGYFMLGQVLKDKSRIEMVKHFFV